MSEPFDATIVGGGPAGVASGCGLARLGFRVVLYTSPRRSGLEGLSPRAHRGLLSLGCDRALRVAVGPVPRIAVWNGQVSSHNHEYVVDRNRFDAALLADARAGGVEVRETPVRRIAQVAGGWKIWGEHGAASSRVLIEARGRRAPVRGTTTTRGPAALALFQRCEASSKRKPFTVFVPFAQGWGWCGQPDAGHGMMQTIIACDGRQLTRRVRRLSRRGAPDLSAQMLDAPETRPWLSSAKLHGDVWARDATSRLVTPLASGNRFRVGDAGVAIDPLSGHGMYEALASALAVAPVINTVLRRPEDAHLATQFFQERGEHAFYRSCDAASRLYAMERRWPTSAYWTSRVDGYQDLVRRSPFSVPHSPTTETRPVVCDDYVAARDVVVTPDHPRGVWKIADVDLVPLLESIRRAEPVESVEAAQRFGVAPAPVPQNIETATQWLVAQGLVSPERIEVTANV